jgi:DNA-binding NtrC family response regulator
MDADGVLWFGLQEIQGRAAVCRWDGQDLDLIFLTGVRDGIAQVVVDTQGDLYVRGVYGLYCYDGETCRCIEESSVPLGSLRPLLRSEGSLWFAGRKGLYLYEKGQFQLREEFDTDHRIIEFLEDPTGAVYLVTGDGQLRRYEHGTLRLIQKLSYGCWAGPCLDRAGRIWIGTYGMGLYCYDTTRFEIFQEGQGLPTNALCCLMEDATGLLLVGTGAGLAGYDGITFHPVERTEMLTNKAVLAMLRDRQGRLWVGVNRPSLGGGILYRYEGGVLHTVIGDVMDPLEFITDLAEDREGRVWFNFRYGHGLGCVENGQVRRFSPEVDTACPSGWIGAMCVDRHGALWMGSWCPGQWEGLCRYDGGRFTRFPSTDGLLSGAVLALYEDREGGLWIGTSAGLCRYDGAQFTTFTPAGGLPHEIVTVITQTEDGTLWFGTEGGGVCHYDGQVFQVITIPGEPGLNDIRAIYQDRHRQIWLGTASGLVRYTPKRMPPEVAVTGVIADRTYTAANVIEIPTTVGRISVCFRGWSPIERASHLIYRYRLEGYDEEWRQTRERQVDYVSLPPGRYRFAVQAVDSDLNYSGITEVLLTVVPDPRIVGLTEALQASGTPGEFIGTSSALQHVLAQIQMVARTDLTVLILGETGTGKGLIARAIHGLSARQEGPFIPVNCGAIPEGLVESELFGHEKGAFTGAVSRRLGRVELAAGGTLFLDEIGDMPLAAQVKLLQFLEERTFERVGGEKILHADVRVLAATNRDLKRMMVEGRFREDLYFRLQTFPLRVPPLRERHGDILALVQYFVERFARHLNRPVPRITPAVLEHLQAYSWPGNVRELEHLVQRAALLCRDGTIGVEDIAGMLGGERPSSDDDSVFLSPAEQKWRREEQEHRHLEEVLKATGWVIYGPRGAAQRLGLHPEKLRARMKKYGLHRPR